jgi:hypothetical protein
MTRKQQLTEVERFTAKAGSSSDAAVLEALAVLNALKTLGG